MSTTPNQVMAQVASHYGAVPTPRTYPEGASQSFVEGEIVVMSGGYSSCHGSRWSHMCATWYPSCDRCRVASARSGKN